MKHGSYPAWLWRGSAFSTLTVYEALRPCIISHPCRRGKDYRIAAGEKEGPEQYCLPLGRAQDVRLSLASHQADCGAMVCSFVKYATEIPMMTAGENHQRVAVFRFKEPRTPMVVDGLQVTDAIIDCMPNMSLGSYILSRADRRKLGLVGGIKETLKAGSDAVGSFTM